jgi:hypothetical protein
MATTKKCSQCKKRMGVKKFYKDKSSKDGLKTYCKECAKKYKK